jgi:truncated hemoglobin YjbI
MIKIKKSEFVKFLKSINEMRSSHSRSFIENEGEEDLAPIDATGTVGANQLSHALPPVEDPEFTPGSTETLRGAMMKIANEVPNSQIENFYRDLLKLFDKTIDTMPELENPFNPVTESVIRMLVEMTEKEAPTEDEVEAEESDDPFGYEEAGPDVYIDLSNVRGSDQLIRDMNARASSADADHVETTVFQVVACAESDVFKNLIETNAQFREDFEDQVDANIMDSQLSSIQSLDVNSDPEPMIQEALANLVDVLGKAFLLAKLNVLEKVFGEKRSNDDVKMSAEVMADAKSIRQVLTYDKVIPSNLHEIAIVSSYFMNDISKEDARILLTDGFSNILSPDSRVAGMSKNRQSEIENGQLEIFLPQDTKVDLSQFDEMGTYDEDTKTYRVDPAVRKMLNYITLVKGGEKKDIFNAAAYFYFTVARATYFANEKKKRDAPAAPAVPAARESGKRKRVRANPGASFKGTLLNVDMNSNLVKGILRNVVNGYVDRLPDKSTLGEFLTSMKDVIVDENGNITQERSLELAKDIISKSNSGASLTELSRQESTIYVNSYSQMTEIYRAAKIKIEEVFENTSKPLYDPETNPYAWQFLSEEEQRVVNSRLKGINMDAVDFLFRYTGHMVSTGQTTFSILNRSSPETGGNYVIEVPVVTFAYIAPFILANHWQKVLSAHWERYKPGAVMSRKAIDPEQEIRKIENYFSKKDEQWAEMAPFVGYSGASGVKQFYEQNVAHRFAFLNRHFSGVHTESGTYHEKILETIYDRLTPFLNDGLENYVKVLERAAADVNLSEEEREYWSDIYELYSQYQVQMNEINDIVMDFGVFDTEAMDDQDWIFDDEEEMVPTDISAKFGNLLKNTIPGRALRLIAHDIAIKYPNKSKSFMPEFSSHVEYAAVEMMVQDASLSLRGAQTESSRRQVAHEVKQYFSGKKVTPNFDKGSASARDLVDNYGFTSDTFIKYTQNIARFIDKMFAKAMQAEGGKEISFSEFGDKIEAYVKKNIPQGMMKKLVDDRLESLEGVLADFSNPENMERVTNIIDNYFIDAYDWSQLNDLYDQFVDVVATVKSEFQQQIDALQNIRDLKKRKSAADKLSKKIRKEAEKRRKPISKQALNISKEMEKRNKLNAKRQGSLL